MSHRDGHIYKGKFVNWRKVGEGKMTYRNGDIYTGVWDGDAGKGTVAYTDGSSYEVKPPLLPCPGRVPEGPEAGGRNLYPAKWQHLHWHLQGR